MVYIIKGAFTVEGISKKNKSSHIWVIDLVTKSWNIVLHFKRNHFKVTDFVTSFRLYYLREWRHNRKSFAFIDSFR